MKKFFTAIFLFLILNSVSYAATSDDIYLRKDVFEAKMDAFMNEIRGEFNVINAKLEALNKRIDDLQASTATRINDSQKPISASFDNLRASMATGFDELKTIFCWGFSILGLLMAFGEFLRNLRKPSVTLEDVKRLIEESKLNMMPQA